MKVLVLCALVAVATAAWSDFIPVQTNEVDQVPLPQKQLDINYLLHKVYEPLSNDRLKSLVATFDPKADVSRYADRGVSVQRLMKELQDRRLQPQRQVFSVFDSRQREQALLLFDVLMQCKDYVTFVSNAAYFRQRMNEGQYAYALAVAVKHSPLTEKVVLPPVYEVIPHYFTYDQVLEEAYIAKITATPRKLRMNRTVTNNPVQNVTYFTEDIGLSTHYTSWHIEYPFWWRDTYGRQIERKGETFFWVHHQLTNRYDAERIASYLNTVEKLRFDEPLRQGFAPQISYKYGGPLPSRRDNIDLQDVEVVVNIEDLIIIQNRIRDAIAHGYVIDEKGATIDIRNERGIDILGNIIESSMYSPNPEYYGSLNNMAHMMLARQSDPQGKYGMPPSVMEHYLTATRDTSFYILHKYIDNLFRKHKDTLPPYKKEELRFPGVEVTSITTNVPLETYFEDYEYSLVSAVHDRVKTDNVEISTYVPRLNYKDFSFNIDVMNNNDREVLSTIRIFAWPLRDRNGLNFTFSEGSWRAVELDKFWKQLQPGKNTITRRSTESSVTVPDVPSTKTLFDRAEEALRGSTDMHLEQYESATGLPNRLLLPKGNEAGMDFMLVVAVTDGSADAAIDGLPTMTKFHHYGVNGVYPDKKPHGYPLDRPVPDERVFREIPNFRQTVVKVYNRGEYIQHN
ncbi:pseudohemocyanin-2-like [Panulirus ornatus]|uniref:pseudohemocyanin-2-like n=1 Tax=Panulirus ornatus TaxID=150431 RepID=UPI003A89CCEC